VRELVQTKDKNGKLAWSEDCDYKRGKRRFKADLIPAPLLIARYYAAEKSAIDRLDAELGALEQQLDELKEEQGSEGGLLEDVIEGDGDRRKITAKSVKSQIQKIGSDPDFSEERNALKSYSALMDKQADCKARLKDAQEALDAILAAKYPKLTIYEVKALVVDDKWMGTLSAIVQAELDRVSQALTGRIKQLAERYGTPLPKINDDVNTLSARVDSHLKKMGFIWK
jgi:type I restriction enzyme M protein